MAESTLDTVNKLFKKELFKIPSKKEAALERIAKELHENQVASGANGRTVDEITRVVKRLFVEKVLVLPDNADANQNYAPEFLNLATNAITTALRLSGQPQLAAAAPLAVESIKFILDKFNRCGGHDRGDPPSGPVVKQNPVNGRFVVRYFVEQDPNTGEPLLPAVEGSRVLARGVLEFAFTSWAGFLKLDVDRADTVATANLIVTGRTFGTGIPRNVLALTDIGPPGGVSGGKPVQLRMVFDLGETYNSKLEFAATAAHEFGHALGIRHRDVSQGRQLMNDMLSDISMPQHFDLEAAVRKGWPLS